MIRQCIEVGFYQQTRKIAKEVMLCKPYKVDYTAVKSYPVISLLNCLGNICENVAAGILED